MQDSFSQSGGDQSTLELIIDQIEELIVTIIEEIRERPGVAAAVLASILGIIVGSILAANLGRRRASPPRKIARKARGIAEAGDLVGIGMKLLQNPIVRGYVVAAVTKQLKRRTSL